MKIKRNKAQEMVREDLIENTFLTAEDLDVLEKQRCCASCSFCNVDGKNNVICTKNIAKSPFEMVKEYANGCESYIISFNAFEQEAKKLEEKYPNNNEDTLILDVVSHYLSISESGVGEA